MLRARIISLASPTLDRRTTMAWKAMPRALSTIVAALVLGLLAQPVLAQDSDLYLVLRAGGSIGLMRHSTAPGSDDPPNFELGDCATQRNLSEGGRALATEVGRRLRDAGISSARIVSSQWCRCLDTAELLGQGPVEERAFFNSLVSYPRESAQMTRDARAWILAQDLTVPTMVVTHQVNIAALVQSRPQEGDIVVVRPSGEGTLEVVGTIEAN